MDATTARSCSSESGDGAPLAEDHRTQPAPPSSLLPRGGTARRQRPIDAYVEGGAHVTSASPDELARQIERMQDSDASTLEHRGSKRPRLRRDSVEYKEQYNSLREDSRPLTEVLSTSQQNTQECTQPEEENPHVARLTLHGDVDAALTAQQRNQLEQLGLYSITLGRQHPSVTLGRDAFGKIFDAWVSGGKLKNLSRTHCVVEYIIEPDSSHCGVYVTDMSTNGIRINGHRPDHNKKMRLKDGDIVALLSGPNGLVFFGYVVEDPQTAVGYAYDIATSEPETKGTEPPSNPLYTAKSTIREERAESMEMDDVPRAPHGSATGVGRWSTDEHQRFVEAIKLFPRGPWTSRAKHIGTRTTRQTISHANKVALKHERHARGLKKAGRPPRKGLVAKGGDVCSSHQIEAETIICSDLTGEHTRSRPSPPANNSLALRTSLLAERVIHDGEEDAYTVSFDIDMSSLIDHVSDTSLIDASSHGSLGVLAEMAAVSADSNHSDSSGRTALMRASSKGSLDVVNALVEGGARVHATCDLGFTPLMLASSEGHEAVVERLLALMKCDLATFCARVNGLNADGDSALSLASQRGHIGTVQVLLGYFARVNGISRPGRTPLDVAKSAEVRNLLQLYQKFQLYRDQCIKLIMDSDASPTIKRVSRLIPLITSVYDITSIVTVAMLCDDSTEKSSLVASIFEHVHNEGLICDKESSLFFAVAIKYFKSAGLVDEQPELCTSVPDNPSYRPESTFDVSIAIALKETYALVMQKRAEVSSVTLRLAHMKAEVIEGCKLVDHIRRYTDGSHNTTVDALERELVRIERDVVGGAFDLEMLRSSASAKSGKTKVFAQAIAVTCSFLFPPVLTTVAPAIAHFAHPIDIVTYIYQEEDVALFLAEASAKQLPVLIEDRLGQCSIALPEFESVMREAIALAHPEYVNECAKRGLALTVDGGKSDVAREVMPRLEKYESSLLSILSHLLEVLDSLVFSRHVCNITEHNENRSPSRKSSNQDTNNANSLHRFDDECGEFLPHCDDASNVSKRGGFRDTLQRLRLSTRAALSESSSHITNSRDSAVVAYVSEIINSSFGTGMSRHSKVLVLGSSVEARATFIQSVADRTPRFQINGGNIQLTDWDFATKHHSSEEKDVQRVTFWNLPHEESLESVNTLLFSKWAIYFVCVSMRSLMEGDTIRWVRLIHARDPTAHITFVDTDTNMSGADQPDVSSLSRSAFLEVVRQYRDAHTDSPDLLSAPTNERASWPQLQQTVSAQIERQGMVRMSSTTLRNDVKATVAKSQRAFVLTAVQLEVMSCLMKQRIDTSEVNNEDEDSSAAFIHSDVLYDRLRRDLPIDKLTFLETLKILHQLGEVHVFEDSSGGPLHGIVCTNVVLWLHHVLEAMNVSRHDGLLALESLENCPRSGQRIRASLIASLIAFPSSSGSIISNLVVPTFLVPKDNGFAAAPLKLRKATPGSTFRWVRNFCFTQHCPDCLITQAFVASHNKLRDFNDNVNVQDGQCEEPIPLFVWDYDRNCLQCTVGDRFIVRVSRVVNNNGGREAVTLTLEAVGAKPHRSTDSHAFQEMSYAIEAVFEQYPGLKVSRVDASWMPREWAYEDVARHCQQQQHRAEALMIDEILYTDKICVVGPRHWGKTSLVQSLTSNTPSIEHPKQRRGVDVVNGYFLEKDLHHERARRHVVTFYDCGGQAKYNAIQALFYRTTTLFAICVDLHAYAIALEQARFMFDDEKTVNITMERFVRRNILSWVDKVYFAKRDAEVVFVATKSDVLKNNVPRLAAIQEHFFGKLKDHKESHTAEIRELLTALVEAEPTKDDATGAPSARATKWLVVSCSTQSSVAVTQRRIQETLIRSQRSVPQPKSYARALTSIMTQRENLNCLEAKSRVASTVIKSEQLASWLRKAIPTADQSMQSHVLKFLHDTGDIMRYEDFSEPQLTTKKVILEPQLVVDFAREIFDRKVASEKVDHVDLENPDTFPLWASVSGQPEMLEMKLILRVFRIVESIGASMAQESDLLVAAFWKHVITYGNIHVGPTYLRHVRSSKSTHKHHVLWKYFLGNVLDENLFMRVAFESYTPLYRRQTFNGLIKYVADKSLSPNERGSTEKEFCQVWIDQANNDEGRYVVCVEAVAQSPFVERVWGPFHQICVAMHEVLTKYYPKEPRVLYAYQTEPNDDIGEADKHKVEDVIQKLRKQSSEGDLTHDLTWMPPNLKTYEDIIPSNVTLTRAVSSASCATKVQEKQEPSTNGENKNASRSQSDAPTRHGLASRGDEEVVFVDSLDDFCYHACVKESEGDVNEFAERITMIDTATCVPNATMAIQLHATTESQEALCAAEYAYKRGYRAVGDLLVTRMENPPAFDTSPAESVDLLEDTENFPYVCAVDESEGDVEEYKCIELDLCQLLVEKDRSLEATIQARVVRKSLEIVHWSALEYACHLGYVEIVTCMLQGIYKNTVPLKTKLRLLKAARKRSTLKTRSVDTNSGRG